MVEPEKKPVKPPREEATIKEQRLRNKSGKIAGIVMIFGGVAWIVGDFIFQQFFIYPIFLIVVGIIAFVKSGQPPKSRRIKKITHNVLDEDEL
ncbi:MAG: hypothetical protein ACFB10_03150 [Salibacteraceae bacterium]